MVTGELLANNFEVNFFLNCNTFDVTGVPDSITFNVAMMICLIRNLSLIAHPINGYDSLPLNVETSPGADLARIKWYRNMLAHHDSKEIPTSDFNTAWSDISDVSVPDSITFNVAMMICLIRNLSLIAHPINGYDSLPLNVETSPGADLARIKWYRNMLAHHDSKEIPTSDFNTAWSDISDCIESENLNMPPPLANKINTKDNKEIKNKDGNKQSQSLRKRTGKLKDEIDALDIDNENFKEKLRTKDRQVEELQEKVEDCNHTA
ncbi:unnamed protein product [Mytilus edulis]|uniref:DZIP3-like HEPN domain-containing protein n=1 Tax=Mytilus edulis TaxID=6550 RepID=A0A8S3U8X7_MYTED|nr:unnamed protein product [Mytilus edulis]